MTKNQIRFFVALMNKCHELGVKPNRTQLHKIAFFAKDSVGQVVPYEFVLHNYGPYSFELDDAIQSLVDSGDLDAVYNPEGYGASYSFEGSELEGDEPVSEDVEDALGRWVDEFARKGTNELELYATALYVAREKPDASREELNDAVRKIKPHFSRGKVSEAFKWLEKKQVLDTAA